MNERFIVTGAGGFIGGNLAKALNARGCSDLILVDEPLDAARRPNLEGVRFSQFQDKSEFRSLLAGEELPPVTTVFHLGACSSTTETNEEYLRDNNFQYTRDLCGWALRTGARFIYASSAATYGDGSRGYSDDHRLVPSLEPLNAYGRSKQQFDLWALETGAIDRIVGIKYFNVYGPGEDHKGDMRSVVNKAYPRVAREGKMTLFKSHRPDCRDGEQNRDFLYIEDAIAATLFFHDHPNLAGLFNVGTGQSRTFLDLAHALFAALGHPPQIDFIDMPETIRDKYQYHTQADITKLRAAGYEAPFLSIEEGVERYVRGWLGKS